MNDIKIIYEDLDILVMDKSAGIIVNRSKSAKEETVQDWIEKNYKLQVINYKLDQSSDFFQRSGIVHRIDKETSGILVAAKNPQSFESLQLQFKVRKVKKTYTALVHGELKGEGEIRIPVGRLPWNRKRFGILAGGRDAVTRYRVIKNLKLKIKSSLEELSLLELYPETGRTHQIRVHLKYLGHPIFGDSLYTGRKTARNDRKILSRLFLHASKISFAHPRSGEVMTFESKLPKELEEILN